MIHSLEPLVIGRSLIGIPKPINREIITCILILAMRLSTTFANNNTNYEQEHTLRFWSPLFMDISDWMFSSLSPTHQTNTERYKWYHFSGHCGMPLAIAKMPLIRSYLITASGHLNLHLWMKTCFNKHFLLYIKLPQNWSQNELSFLLFARLCVWGRRHATIQTSNILTKFIKRSKVTQIISLYTDTMTFHYVKI